MNILPVNTSKNAQRFFVGSLVFLFATTTLVACAGPTTPGQSGDIHKIQHVIIIMQENRSFDTYFGTYPGADGIPMQNGVPTVCVMDPKNKQCVMPFHDPKDVNGGGPHNYANATSDING